MARCLPRTPDFNQFLAVLKREKRPRHLPFYEHIASPEFIAVATGLPFDRLTLTDPGYWQIYVDFWLELGFDCIPLEIPLNCPLAAGHGAATEESEARAVIRTLAEFEQYPWPDVAHPLDFSHFATVAKLLPPGVKIVGGVCMGPYEWVSTMMGTLGLSYALADCPELVERMFATIGDLHVSAVRQLATIDAIGALRQGDDLGFKTSTFLCPADLRRWVFPTYTRMVAAAHQAGKPFILHSCGNLAAVYDDLIDGCRIDAKHSFEDVILPVTEFKKQYGRRVTPLGGLDVDVICRSRPDELRAYTRRMIEACFNDGWWALGTGNSLTPYMPVANYRIVIEEGLKVSG